MIVELPEDQASGSTGTIKYSGGSGGNGGTPTNSGGGGGGSSATASVNGVDGSDFSGGTGGAGGDGADGDGGKGGNNGVTSGANAEHNPEQFPVVAEEEEETMVATQVLEQAEGLN